MSSNVPLAPPNLKEADPRSVAVGKFLRHNKLLKQRQGILGGKRQDFFRVKRAIRALQSPEYAKLSSKEASNLPKVTDRDSAIEVMKLMPLNRLAFRVNKLETQDALSKGLKPVSGVPVLEVAQMQEFGDDMYYVWFYEPIPIMTYVYAGLVLLACFILVLFPLWPYTMRVGVWYLSMGMLGLFGAFFGLAIVRLVVYIISYPISRGFWMFPNLFEDVGFFESFVPLYGWDGVNYLPKPQKKKKKAKKVKAPESKPDTEESAEPGPPSDARQKAIQAMVVARMKDLQNDVMEAKNNAKKENPNISVQELQNIERTKLQTGLEKIKAETGLDIKIGTQPPPGARKVTLEDADDT